MAKPVVVIVGRTNVGKSTLFNRITGSHTAIVEDIPGVTRDRNYLDAEWEGKHFFVVDTGGFYAGPADDIARQVTEQAMFAVGEGDIIIQMLDGKEGLTPSDRELAGFLRASGKTVLWAVNKVDGPTREERLYDFYTLGTDRLWPISAATGYGFDDFMDNLVSLFPDYKEEETDYPKIAVVGRPNVGKSTLVNTLLSKERMIVSPVPGTTRDSIDSVCTYYGRKYLLIDTAGMRQKDRTGYSVERFSMVRALRSIERCDVALIVIDSTEGIVEQDQKIAGIVADYGKGAVFLLNKWDLVENTDETYEKLERELAGKMWFMHYAPLLTVSAMQKKRVTKVFALVDEIIGERKKRISTADLNKTFGEMTSRISLPLYKGKEVRLFYITQVKTEPPSFTVFANYPAGIKDSHRRHFEKVLRKAYTFKGTPVRIYLKARQKEKKKHR